MKQKDFYSLLLDSDDKALVSAYFMEFTLNVEQINQAINSKHKELYADCLYKRFYSNSEIPSVAVEDKGLQYAPYLQQIDELKAYNLPLTDRASKGVRALIAKTLTVLKNKEIYLIGQMVGKSSKALGLGEEEYKILSKTIKRCDGIDLAKSVVGLDVAITPVLDKLAQKRAEDEKQETLKQKQIEKLRYQKYCEGITSLPLCETPFFSESGEFYQKSDKGGKNRLTRIKGRLEDLGVKKLNDFLSFSKEEKEEYLGKYYNLFQEAMSFYGLQ